MKKSAEQLILQAFSFGLEILRFKKIRLSVSISEGCWIWEFIFKFNMNESIKSIKMEYIESFVWR